MAELGHEVEFPNFNQDGAKQRTHEDMKDISHRPLSHVEEEPESMGNSNKEKINIEDHCEYLHGGPETTAFQCKLGIVPHPVARVC